MTAEFRPIPDHAHLVAHSVRCADHRMTHARSHRKLFAERGRTIKREHGTHDHCDDLTHCVPGELTIRAVHEPKESA